jgi:tRNA(Ile)-lysidine synthase
VSDDGSLPARFLERLAALGGSGPVVVALSGGMDSCVLLHLARFAVPDARRELVAAHFDHRLRASSQDDARWVAGLCRAWDVPLRLGVAEGVITSEEEARNARYRFLESVRREAGAALVLTAHHADDQAETVLFRLFRGAGSRGLAGIPAHRDPSIARPLLDFWRSELEDYAAHVLLQWRDDPTNRDPGFARNALRHRILPDVERWVAPGARRALVRLADLAGDEEAAWASVLPQLLEPLEVREVEDGFTFRRAPFLALHPAVRMRVLRLLSAQVGISLDHASTRRAVEFAESAASGRAIDLGGRLTFGADLERFLLARSGQSGRDEPLTIEGVGPGRGTAVLAGTAVPVSWGDPEAARHHLAQAFEVDALRFPLVVRSRRPGDRISLPGGTKKVKKVLLERRVPLSERHRIPLLVDAEGEVLWIPGVARASWPDPTNASDALRIGIG